MLLYGRAFNRVFQATCIDLKIIAFFVDGNKPCLFIGSYGHLIKWVNGKIFIRKMSNILCGRNQWSAKDASNKGMNVDILEMK